MNILAIIPAKKNSKGLPNKNTLKINKHPLIAYSIAAGIQTPQISRVLCSTDSIEIARIARKYGAETPFIRPKSISKTLTTDLEVFKHALAWLKKNENYSPDLVIQFRPTSPIRFIKDIQKGLKIIKKTNKIDSIRSVAEPLTTPYKMWTIAKTGNLKPLLVVKNHRESYNAPRQILPKIFAQNGSLEIIKTEVITKKNSMTGKNIYPLIMSTNISIDIDTMFSLKYAESLIKNFNCIKP